MGADGSGDPAAHVRQGRGLEPGLVANGRLIAFTRDGLLYVIPPRGGAMYLVPTSSGATTANPHGRRTASGSRMSVAGPGTARERSGVYGLTAGPRHVTHLNASSYGPAWSPDGRKIVFSNNANDGRYQLYEIGTNGKGLTRLTFHPVSTSTRPGPSTARR